MESILCVMTCISSVAALVSTIIAAAALINSQKTQTEMKEANRKQATIEDFNMLQVQVLDKLVSLDRKNACEIIDGMDDDEEFRAAYGDYKALIARLEHFSVGVNEGVYDIDVVDKLAGEHLIHLYNKVEPIIEKVNENSTDNQYYHNYCELVNTLRIKHTKKGE